MRQYFLFFQMENNAVPKVFLHKLRQGHRDRAFHFACDQWIACFCAMDSMTALQNIPSESLGFSKGSAGMETSPQRPRLIPGLGVWGVHMECSSAELPCKCSSCIWGRGGSFTCSVIPSLGLLGKALVGSEISVVAFFHWGLELSDGERSGPACL